MSTSSGSRVRRLGTMAMSSNPYARRPDLPMPISTSATQPALRARIGEAAQDTGGSGPARDGPRHGTRYLPLPWVAVWPGGDAGRWLLAPLAFPLPPPWAFGGGV